jgi:hypothetical protein
VSAIRRTVYLPGDEPAELPLVDTATVADETQTRWAYSNLQPLRCCAYPRLDRQIGVLASRPFHHHGLNASYVDISRETLHINTCTYGNCYPEETAAAEIRRATQDTIDDLDRVIVELVEHRDRLKETIAEFGGEGQQDG